MGGDNNKKPLPIPIPIPKPKESDNTETTTTPTTTTGDETMDSNSNVPSADSFDVPSCADICTSPSMRKRTSAHEKDNNNNNKEVVNNVVHEDENDNDDDDHLASTSGSIGSSSTTTRRKRKIESMDVEFYDTVKSEDEDLDVDHHIAMALGRRPVFFRWIPRLWRYDDAPLEATGCAMDMASRATIFMTAFFLGPALLELATAQALSESNCGDTHANATDAELEERDVCVSNMRVHGLKPSALLTDIGFVAGLVSALVLPIFGAIVDHTPHRRRVGAISAAGLTLIKMIELSIGPATWFLVAILQIASSVLFQMHVAAVYAYVFDLSPTPGRQPQFQTHFFLCMYISMLVYMIEVLVPGFIWGTNDIETAQWAILVTILTTIPLFSIAWTWLFRDCPPVSEIPPEKSIIVVGFSKLYQTYNKLLAKPEYPEVKIFLAGVMFSEAADAALATIAMTHMSEYLQMESMEIGPVILVVLMARIPGTWLGNFCSRLSSPVKSAQICLILYMSVTAGASLVLNAGRRHWAFLLIFGALWGICQGWMHPMHTAIFVTITPPTMEWMGVFLVSCQILAFLPHLIFTVLHEVGLSMAWGLASLIAYFGIGLIGLLGMGDYDQAVARVQSLPVAVTSPSGEDEDDDEEVEKKISKPEKAEEEVHEVI